MAGHQTSCRARVPPSDRPLLVLGAHSIRQRDFELRLAPLEAREGKPLVPKVRRALLQSYLEEQVLILEARNRGLVGLGASPVEEQAAVRMLLRQSVLADVQVSEAAIATYYADHLAQLRQPETVTLRQIVVPTTNEARDVKRRVQKDPKAFDLLARSRSHAPEASAGGLMGTFERGQLPPSLEAAAFGLPVGGMSDLVQTPLGVHVIMVEARQAARERTLDECREEIRARLAREEADRATHAFVGQLLARAKVNHEAVASLSSPS